MKVTPQELAIRLAWDLETKEKWAVNRICDFILEMDGECYNAFSGGKDSRTIKDLIDGIWDGRFEKYIPPHVYKKVTAFPKPKDVFCNTGLEFPEIVDYVKSFDDVTIMKPLMGFVRVIKEIGVAVGSKKIAMMVRRLKGYIENPSSKNQATKNLYLHGVKQDGSKSKGSRLPRWALSLLNAPFPVSDQCCDIFKKEPFRRYEAETGQKPIIGTTVVESAQRKLSYYITGCNSFEEGSEKCRPISIWTEEDIWNYAKKYNITHCSVYYDRTVEVVELDGSVSVKFLVAEKSTGCLFCLFGLHLEPKDQNNRIQRLALSHPKRWEIVVIKCGLNVVLDFIGIKYHPIKRSCQLSFFEKEGEKKIIETYREYLPQGNWSILSTDKEMTDELAEMIVIDYYGNTKYHNYNDKMMFDTALESYKSFMQANGYTSKDKQYLILVKD